MYPFKDYFSLDVAISLPLLFEWEGFFVSHRRLCVYLFINIDNSFLIRGNLFLLAFS